MAEATTENLTLGLDAPAIKRPNEVKPQKKREHLTRLFTTSSINPDPTNNEKNPRVRLPKGTVLRNMPFDYGADEKEILTGEEVIAFLNHPSFNKETRTWNWYVMDAKTSTMGYISTRHRARGTVFSRHEGKDRSGTISGKPQYGKYQQKDIAFISEDIV